MEDVVNSGVEGGDPLAASRAVLTMERRGAVGAVRDVEYGLAHSGLGKSAPLYDESRPKSSPRAIGRTPTLFLALSRHLPPLAALVRGREDHVQRHQRLQRVRARLG